MIGARPSFAGFDFDLQSSYKTLLDADTGFDDGTFEFKADAMRAIGPVKTRLRAEYSPDGLGGTEEWSWGLGPDRLSLGPQPDRLGRGRLSRSGKQH